MESVRITIAWSRLEGLPSVSQTQNFQVHLMCHLSFALWGFQKHHASDLHNKFARFVFVLLK